MLDLYIFVLEEFLTMEPGDETCMSLIIVISFIPLRVYVGWYADCKIMHRMKKKYKEILSYDAFTAI